MKSVGMGWGSLDSSAGITPNKAMGSRFRRSDDGGVLIAAAIFRRLWVW